MTISWLVDNSEQTLKPAEALAKAFTAKNPNITVKIETRPQGGDGDNVVKTRLATGEMTDVFMYNSGSLFQALSPEKNLVPLTDQPWVNDLEDAFKPTVSANEQLYGAPFGGSIGGGVLYNRKVYDAARARGPQDVGRVHGQQRQDQGRGHRAGDPDLPGDVDVAAAGPGQPPQRRRRRSRAGPRSTRPTRRSSRRSRRSRASSGSRRSTRPGSRTRTTAPRSSTRACASWRPARARTTRC